MCVISNYSHKATPIPPPKAAYNFGKSYQLPGTTVHTFLPGFKEGTNKIT